MTKPKWLQMIDDRLNPRKTFFFFYSNPSDWEKKNNKKNIELIRRNNELNVK